MDVPKLCQNMNGGKKRKTKRRVKKIIRSN